MISCDPLFLVLIAESKYSCLRLNLRLKYTIYNRLCIGIFIRQALALRFGPDTNCDRNNQNSYVKRKDNGKSFSLYYNDLARWLFITLAFSGILSTGWFGIPLAPRYFLSGEVDLISGLFALLSALGTIWGIMAYVEFTRSANLVNDARHLSRSLDPSIGDY